ncbi:MAG: hypothetical protein Q4B54_09620, partial [Coriobacteriales bacterium]|nr:hypothetical protein [Coriobacteriales bacterium]
TAANPWHPDPHCRKSLASPHGRTCASVSRSARPGKEVVRLAWPLDEIERYVGRASHTVVIFV